MLGNQSSATGAIVRTEIEQEQSFAWNDLSTQQREIMLGLASGMSNREIAEHLGLKLSTVRNNLAAVYDMLGFSNRVQALLWVLSFDDLAERVLRVD